ncbi:DUF1934 domain-containing protein [Lactobacillus terrae]|uniref:DUF1934 domain-containing protein n=1 Tax=Lactobacillus terrae TaxID=2269374 RepID=UPI000C1B7200|nr:DUF1934 domain-containing protein [Lactobacillus terrae]
MENNTDVSVELNIDMQQEDEISRTTIIEPGKFSQVGKSFYLRFSEKLDDSEEALITVKITEDGDVLVRRVASSTKLSTNLYFTHGDYNSGQVQTEYGLMPMRTFTKNLSAEFSTEPLAGNIKVDYDLIIGENVIGNYKFRLIFNA